MKTEFPFLSNNRAIGPHRPTSLRGAASWPLTQGMCCPVRRPAWPDSLVRTSCRRLSWQWPQAPVTWAAEELDGDGPASSPVPGRQPACPGARARTSAAAFHPRRLPWCWQEAGSAAVPVSWGRKRVQRGQGKLCPGPPSWYKSELGLKRALLGPRHDFAPGATSLLSPASGLSAPPAVPALCPGLPLFQNAPAVSRALSESVSSPCMSHPA